jgi:hypothetical protein
MRLAAAFPYQCAPTALLLSSKSTRGCHGAVLLTSYASASLYDIRSHAAIQPASPSTSTRSVPFLATDQTRLPTSIRTEFTTLPPRIDSPSNGGGMTRGRRRSLSSLTLVCFFHRGGSPPVTSQLPSRVPTCFVTLVWYCEPPAELFTSPPLTPTVVIVAIPPRCTDGDQEPFRRLQLLLGHRLLRMLHRKTVPEWKAGYDWRLSVFGVVLRECERGCRPLIDHLRPPDLGLGLDRLGNIIPEELSKTPTIHLNARLRLFTMTMMITEERLTEVEAVWSTIISMLRKIKTIANHPG